jgi:L-ascorbate metabolism protein UlaG (beta-lactamase superfamily)
MRFRNADGSGPHPLSNVLRWALFDRLRGKRRRSPARAEVPRVAPDLDRLRTPPARGEGARLTWLGHASWLVQLDGVSLLIDPVLFDAAAGGFLKRNVPAGVSVDQLPPIDASLVTHNHFDHLDLRTLQAVGARAIVGTGMSANLKGVAASELGWWDVERVGDARITFVPSQHWSRRGFFDTNQTLWGGFVVQGSSATVFHSGDTAWFEGFREIGQKLGPIDAALLPIGAYDPAWFMEKQHMNPEQAVQAFEDLDARSFLAMHWGTFKLTDEPLDEPPQRLRAEWQRRGLPPERCRIPAVGETIDVRR